MSSVAPKQNRSSEKSLRDLLAAAQQDRRQNRLLEAARNYLAAARLRPDCFEAFCQLGVILDQLNQLKEAVPCLQTAIRLNPKRPKLNLFLGGIYKKLGRFDDAVACCRREMEIEPANADAHYNLGLALQNLGRLEEAVAAYQKAVELRPDYVDALVNLGSVSRQGLNTGAALRCFEEAIRREPQNPKAHWERCATLLALGDYERGWPEYEWRWRQNDFATPPPLFPQPRWNGSDLGGRRIFLYPEQGYGDTIQFARYATLVARRGGVVIIGSPPPLRALMATIPGVREVATNRATLPRFDVYAPLMSLPAIFGTTLETVPVEIPYLAPPRNDFKFENTNDGQFRVGIAWAGARSHKNDSNRSAPLECFLPLMELPGVRCHSLQVGDGIEELSQPQVAGKITDLGSRFRDFGDTAQAVAQMDLIVSVDTCVAHLAGAMGKSVWTLLPYEAEWRWMLRREDTPWYPGMRLFRQTDPGNWNRVLVRVAVELTDRLSKLAGERHRQLFSAAEIQPVPGPIMSDDARLVGSSVN
jgi:Flp pilus assembly protein TadD